MDLKPGQVRIFQCESCGEVFDENSPEANSLQHTAVEYVDDGHGSCDAEPYPCGPISERILIADEALIRREVIKDCLSAIGDAYALDVPQPSNVRIDRALGDLFRACSKNIHALIPEVTDAS